jgi:hypothetical protein
MPFITHGFFTVTIGLLASAVAAQAATVKETFETLSLLGTWAVDCAAPVSEDNPYVVYRPLESYVQRDTMSSATKRSDASIIDRAETTKPNVISMSMSNAQRRINVVMLIEPKRRIRTVESALESGEKLVVSGRLSGGGAELPWLNRCAQ